MQSSVRLTTRLWLILLCSTVLPLPALAEEESDANAKVQYIDMKPSFVLNYGAPSNKLKYAKVDIALRVNSKSAATTVENHMPLLRNSIVLLLSRQPQTLMSDISGRETVRINALDQLNAVLNQETNTESIADLLFTSFVVQG